MTFDLSHRLSEWGSDPIDRYPSLAAALGLEGLEDRLRTDPQPYILLFPYAPQYNRLGLKLHDIPARHFLGCYDEAVIERAFLLGLDLMVHREPNEVEEYGAEQLAKKLWVHDERYRIVHTHPFVEVTQ